ncbi:MAG TPA: acyl-CoA dehydratase activase [bacterium]|nr:acyl-CoA dehydratase activase [bacterium]
MKTDRSLGICFGASTVTMAVVAPEADGRLAVTQTVRREHRGNPRQVLADFFATSPPDHFRHIAITGRKFASLLKLPAVPEPEAIEAAAAHLGLAGKYDTIVSLGGETFFVYGLDRDGKIARVETGNKCASGTGEFFLQQLGRMNLGIADALPLAETSAPHHISGRCSVFCKSDCTHALNLGMPPGEVVAGLCKMMAGKIVELLAKGKPEKIVAIGGVAQNRSVLKFLREKHPLVYVPAEAPWFEALGAALLARQRDLRARGGSALFREQASNFTFHPPLAEYAGRVHWKKFSRGTAQANDLCLVGLDVGSTTTKAVVMRTGDLAVLASVYLRTNGQPVRAAVECYAALAKQLTVPVSIIGLGVTGSGRHIAGLHALTDGIVNEIIAHATAAVHFDPEVETIFEIGGQDAKYTAITNRVPTDYAMNEACSAGTGSFLEEAAKESLGVEYTAIGDIALTAKRPPNFNDQCAAFISSDIKTALQEGLGREDIIAGLVYSVCLNYANRVKGNRPVGKKVFLQGGVCYNRAVPVAMAALTGTDIVVPPEPGLMGAYGVALVIRERLELGLLQPGSFDLAELADRPFSYGKSFTCRGGAEKCDRKCKIAMVEVGGRQFPFGGACDRYYNQRREGGPLAAGCNLVALRQQLVYEKYARVLAPRASSRRKTVGINRSFIVNTFYPLYYHFFTALGFRVLLSQQVDPEGFERVGAPFCYPVELAHGLLADLLRHRPDYLFMPQVAEVHTARTDAYQKTCVFVQGEPYYLPHRFQDRPQPQLLAPVLNFAAGYAAAEDAFAGMAKELGVSVARARAAYRKALGKFEKMLREFKTLGAQALAELEQEDRFAVVLFGRAYNAFAREANLGIPQKLASRGITVIPHDFLPTDGRESYPHMYWGLGAQILRGTRVAVENPRLFGVYITNFSCGPDSFLLSYFRTLMGNKPSLTLELDSHSADAGINTRIDAALDIFASYRRLRDSGRLPAVPAAPGRPLHVRVAKGRLTIADAVGREFRITDRKLTVIVPSMGELSTAAMVAIMRAQGINAVALPVATAGTLRLGRQVSTCKECLPFLLTTGSMLEYLRARRTDDPVLFFMPTGCGPCRQGQYLVRLRDIITAGGFANVGILSLDDENAYGGLGTKFTIACWEALVISDAFEDAQCALFTLATDRAAALRVFARVWEKVLLALADGSSRRLTVQLEAAARQLARIPLVRPLREAKVVALIGEMFVRRDYFSRLDLLVRLAERGFVVRTAPVAEFIYYCNHLAKKPGSGVRIPFFSRLQVHFNEQVQVRMERRLRGIIAKSGLIVKEPVVVGEVMAHSRHLIREELIGEAILTVGSALREIKEHACGVIAIGPFACMPSRIAESVLGLEMTEAGKARATGAAAPAADADRALPFLALETDGNPFPLILQAKLDIFMLQAERLHDRLRGSGQ